MDCTIVFNNAGVLVFSRGHKAAALDLFRGALETKLLYERRQQAAEQRRTNVTPAPGRCVTPDCVLRAAEHLSNIALFASQANESDPALEDGITEPVVPYESRDFNPYIIARPFELPLDRQASTQLASAVIVFNLGLVHHAASRTSAKAASFYEISAALLASEPILPESALLRVAIMNNFGVWCYDNGDGESLRTCMEHLMTVLKHSDHYLDPTVGAHVQTNIDWLLTPPNGGSPAA